MLILHVPFSVFLTVLEDQWIHLSYFQSLLKEVHCQASHNFVEDDGYLSATDPLPALSSSVYLFSAKRLNNSLFKQATVHLLL